MASIWSASCVRLSFITAFEHTWQEVSYLEREHMEQLLADKFATEGIQDRAALYKLGI